MERQGGRNLSAGLHSSWQNVTAPTIEDAHDARKQVGSDHGVAFVREMDKVKSAIAHRNELIVHDYANRASLQPALHLRNVGSALLPSAEETQIVAAGLQDNDVCPIRHILVDAAEHHPRSFKWHSGIGDLSIDALGSEQGLQLRGYAPWLPTYQPWVLLAPIATYATRE